MLNFDFAGKVVLVTGGAQGIGAAISQLFARHAATVVVADLQAETALAGRRLEAEGLLAVPARWIWPSRNRPPHWCAGAGTIWPAGCADPQCSLFPLTAFADITPSLLQRTLAVNLQALFWLSQAALPAMRAQGGGRILATSSVTGPRVAYPGLAHYAASKAGVNGFIRAAALELAADGITVNGVEPGMIRTRPWIIWAMTA
jgi:3-oxoacyl-[acyl-carrier protein] reductase